jgi:hypothetical protein
MSGASQGVTDADIAAAITPLTDYFNDNFKILNQTLTNSGMTLVMSKLWKEVLITLESLLVPTLSDKPSHQRQLSQQETEVVFKWLQVGSFLKIPDEGFVAHTLLNNWGRGE